AHRYADGLSNRSQSNPERSRGSQRLQWSDKIPVKEAPGRIPMQQQHRRSIRTSLVNIRHRVTVDVESFLFPREYPLEPGGFLVHGQPCHSSRALGRLLGSRRDPGFHCHRQLEFDCLRRFADIVATSLEAKRAPDFVRSWFDQLAERFQKFRWSCWTPLDTELADRTNFARVHLQRLTER